MGKVVVVTSGKGGVGKTTSTAALGAALAQTGMKVVLIDFDVGLRNLDLVHGRRAARRVRSRQRDAGNGQAFAGADPRQAARHAVPAAGFADARQGRAHRGGRGRASSRKLREKFDYVLCDSPAGIERGAQLAMRFADEAVIVTNPEVSSVRDSDRIIGLLDSRTLKAEQGEQRHQAHPGDALRCGARRARRDAQHRRRSRDPFHAAARESSRRARASCAHPISARR